MKGSRPLLALGATVLGLGLVLAVDRLAGALRPDPALTRGLAFPPGAALTYELHEFTFTARINAFGFRDGEVSEHAPAGRLRVLALGDSFTFGWGVDLPDTWVKRVEAALRARGHDVEVLDLGVPGFWPGPEADLAEVAIPALRPDLVLVGLLQGDDLRQADPEWAARLAVEAAGGAAPDKAPRGEPTGLAALVPNLARLVAAGPPVESDPAAAWERVRSAWIAQAAGLVAHLNAVQRARYAALPAAWREAFEDGRVPLWAMQRLFLEPPNPAYERDLDSPEMRRRIEAAASHLARLKAAAVAGGADVLVLSVPSAAYANPAAFSGLSDIGTGEELLTTVPDRAAAEACARAGLPFKQVTAEFRRRAAREPLYYKVDAHFNAEGNRVFAELVTPWVEAALPRR